MVKSLYLSRNNVTKGLDCCIKAKKERNKDRKEKGAEISISLLYQKKESVCSLHLESFILFIS
jgi:hypothetical protein